jgi:hypothetical protein
MPTPVKTGALALLKRLVHTSHVHVHLVAGEMSVKKVGQLLYVCSLIRWVRLGLQFR